MFNNNFKEGNKQRLKIIDINYFLKKKIDRIIYLSINLSFLHYNRLFAKFINANCFKYWIDGYGYKILPSKKRFVKTPGRNILKNLLNKIDNYNYNKISFIGDLKLEEKNFFVKFFSNKKINIKLSFYNPGYGKIFEVAKKMKPSKSNEVTIICLPTPMQEICAMFIANKSKKFKIICAGGAIHMITGYERAISDKYDLPLLETLYRLRSDTRRRLARFLASLFSTIIGINEIKKNYEIS
jgi:hypothetical protein